ncbi:tagatose 1,6-diphosphate aldolase GatY/KbaY [Lachnospiraceae bacterium]|nr:tagatose 1,6-diphosphate aldolase GatY/KbaY [Lachnospiraceae bacterium]
MYTTSKEMLLKAQQGGYAVGAFNAENMEMIRAIIAAAEELKAPVMIQTTPGTVRYASLETYAAIVKAEAEKVSVPVCLHLDHGESYEMAVKAIQVGYSSVMIDGSKLPLEENIALSKRVADVGRACGVPVEAELGRVGGKEDDTESKDSAYTDPEEAKRFVEETGVDSLAIGIGTAHGVYKVKPVLNTQRISEVKEVVSIPLVLHGSSGLSDEDVRDCVRRGMCKVNFATELRQEYLKATRKLLSEDESIIDPKKIGKAAMEAVKKQVEYRMKVCGCDGKA